jgi:lipoate-protein ligase B
MLVQDLGTMKYREAWALQERVHADVLAGGEERLLLVEHPPVITLGRRPGLAKNILASAEALERTGVEVVESDRGGDVTFHGPGQLVAYPIVRLNDHQLSVGGYVRRLQEIVIATLNDLSVPAKTDPAAIGVWTCDGQGAACELAKICAIGVRIRRGVSMHGIALNVTTDLSYFDLIVPCGLAGRPVTSLQKLLGEQAGPMPQVKAALAARMCAVFAPCHVSPAATTMGA